MASYINGQRARGVGGLQPTGGTMIPGVQPSAGNPRGVPYGLPPFSTPGPRSLPGTMPPALLGKRVQSETRGMNMRGLQAGLGGAVPPPLKRPRGMPTSPYMRPTTPMAGGRGITPSMVTNSILNLERARSQWKTGDRSDEFSSTTRLVEVNQNELAFALYLKSQFVFNDTQSYNETGTGMIRPRFAHSHRGLPPSRGITRLLSLPYLNYMLRVNDKIRGDPDDWNSTWTTPLEVVQQYTPDGFVRTDPMESEHPAFRNTQVREYVVTLAGRDNNVINIWGLLRKLQTVWLIVKRLDANKVPSDYVISAAQSGNRRPVPQSNNRVRYHRQPLQIIPWTDPDKREPDIEDLTWFDVEEGVERRGVAICLGWVNEPSDSAGTYSRARAWYDAKSIMQKEVPMVDITVNRRIKTY